MQIANCKLKNGGRDPRLDTYQAQRTGLCPRCRREGTLQEVGPNAECRMPNDECTSHQSPVTAHPPPVLLCLVCIARDWCEARGIVPVGPEREAAGTGALFHEFCKLVES